jgi:ankyrin repeat protein
MLGRWRASVFASSTRRSAPIAERASEALAILRTAYPDDPPGRLMKRAIEQDQPFAVLGILEGTDVDINAPCDPDVHDSVSALFTALQSCRARVAALLAGRPDLSLERSIPAHAAWDWAERCPLDVLETFVCCFPDAVSRADGDGVTLLHAVVRDVGGTEKLAYLLAQPGVDPDARQSDGTTPWYRAALAGSPAAVRLLLKRPVDVNARNDDNGWTVLMVAAAFDAPEIVAELLRQEAIDVNARDERGATALHLAARAGHDRVAAMLADHPGAALNIKDAEGRTALSLASFAGATGVVEHLLAHPDLDVNLVDRDRQTALHWAAVAGHRDVVRARLADPRTNPGLTNRPDGRTALEVAAAAGHRVVAADLAERMLTDAGSDELSAGDTYEPREEAPSFSAEPFEPEPPRLDRPDP